MKMYYLLILMSIFISCGTLREASINEENRNSRCELTVYEGKALEWRLIANKDSIDLQKTIGKTILPKAFTIYQLSNKSALTSFFKEINQDCQSKLVNLPLPENRCTTFEVIRSEIMSEELAAKFPEIISLKGAEQLKKQNTIRVDLHEDQLEIEFNLNGKIYFLSTWPGKEGNYYLLYKKEDAGFEKIPYQKL